MRRRKSAVQEKYKFTKYFFIALYFLFLHRKRSIYGIQINPNFVFLNMVFFIAHVSSSNWKTFSAYGFFIAKIGEKSRPKMYTTKIEDSFENEDFTAHFLTTGLPKFPLRTLNIVDVYFLVVITIFHYRLQSIKLKKN